MIKNALNDKDYFRGGQITKTFATSIKREGLFISAVVNNFPRVLLFTPALNGAKSFSLFG